MVVFQFKLEATGVERVEIGVKDCISLTGSISMDDSDTKDTSIRCLAKGGGTPVADMANVDEDRIAEVRAEQDVIWFSSPLCPCQDLLGIRCEICICTVSKFGIVRREYAGRSWGHSRDAQPVVREFLRVYRHGISYR
jgi:hypothetical protein